MAARAHEALSALGLDARTVVERDGFSGAPERLAVAWVGLRGRSIGPVARVRAAFPALPIVMFGEDLEVDLALAAHRFRVRDYLPLPLDPVHVRECLTDIEVEYGLALTEERALTLAVGRTLRRRLAALDLSLQQVAARAGISASLLSQLELGRSSGSVLSLLRAARALGLQVGALFAEFDGGGAQDEDRRRPVAGVESSSRR